MLIPKPGEVKQIDIWKRPTHGSTHTAMTSLAAWFVRHIPFSYDFAIDHHSELAVRPLADILRDLIRLECGCMCGGLSLLMAQLAKQEGYDALELNFGRLDGPESHVIVLVGKPGYHVIYDPTFGCFSSDAEGRPVSIETATDILRRGRSTELHWTPFAPRERLFLFARSNEGMLPLKSEKTELGDDRFVASVDLDAFADIAWSKMLEWARTRRQDCRSSFDLLRFPLGTSGEPKVTKIAELLSAL